MTLWFTSDEHVGHRNIVSYCARPFLDEIEMRTELIRRHNERVRSDDVVWHLGDVALDHRLVDAYIRELNGKHYLIPGNHDACHPCHGKSRAKRMAAKFYTAFANHVELAADSIQLSVSRRLDGLGEVLMCHLPYAGDRSEHDRYPEFRPNDAGFILLHGHVHEKWKRSGRMLNVGVDQWDFAPVSVEEIVAFMQPSLDN